MVGAWNAALERTDSEYILRLDGDDILLPGCLSEQLRLLDANPDAAMAYGKMMCADAAMNPNGVVMGKPFSRFNMAQANPAGHGGTLIRRSHLLEVGNYKETALGRLSVGLDYFLWWRLATRRQMLFVDRFCYLYRRHGAQNTAVRQSNFQTCKSYMMDDCLSANPDLAATLKANPSSMVANSLKFHAMLVLGILAERVGVEGGDFGKLVDAAISLDPSDYGARLGAFRLLSKAGRFDDALDLCRPIAIDENASPFVRMEFASQAAKLLVFLNRKEEASQWAVLADHFQGLYMGFKPEDAISGDFAKSCGLVR